MKKSFLFLLTLLIVMAVSAQELTFKSPDNRTIVNFKLNGGIACYSVSYDGKIMLDESPLGLVTNTGDFTKGLVYDGYKTNTIKNSYSLNRSKVSKVDYVANEQRVDLKNSKNTPFSIVFRISNNNVAFRYELPKSGETGSVRVLSESTGFDFPSYTTTFLTPQSHAMIGWKRTKPSYEEEYRADAPMTTRSQYGHGYTFPGLFRIGDDGWVLVSETGVSSNYCGSRLSDMKDDGLYTIEYPMMEENNGNGTVEPAVSLPGATPWRTITVGATLEPIVETTAPWENVEPLYETKHDYKFGKGTWSWIVWQDNSINLADQKKYVDLASEMGFQYTLVDNWWDTKIGKEGIEELVKYARSKNVEIFLWYSSSGNWNDIEQGPINIMSNPIKRKEYMRWMNEIGVKGIKVDFFGGDKQVTMAHYEAILSDADDNGLMVIFHGCTLPRGWERMYPNYVGSEAVLASENMVFGQRACDMAAFNATLHPFIRNTVGCMEFGGTFLSRRLSKGNTSGTIRKTTDCAELATAVLFQNPIQNFALAPENLNPVEENGAPIVSLDFMREVPTTWDETQYIAGYPGKYVVLARRSGDKWYIAGINAEKEPIELTLNIPMLQKGDVVELYSDDKKSREPMKSDLKIKKNGEVKLTLLTDGGFIIVK
ncbi:MAG: glycoside hydrolase family 97 protein [Bacteroidaceae bacterium]|nr:glycoside hydrolase family 97 protein [Bacteroidaceae bacterium]